jgi:hypothetical protein
LRESDPSQNSGQSHHFESKATVVEVKHLDTGEEKFASSALDGSFERYFLGYGAPIPSKSL